MKALTVIAALVASAVITRANYDEPPGVYFAKDKARWAGTLPTKHFARAGNRRQELAIIMAEARRQGVPEQLAYKVCRVESGCRLNATGPMTRHGRHTGAYQTRPNVAARFGYRPSEGPLQGMVGLRYGLAHLADCYRRARRNERLAARCHVGGPGAMARRLTPKAERYAQRYVIQVEWAGSL